MVEETSLLENFKSAFYSDDFQKELELHKLVQTDNIQEVKNSKEYLKFLENIHDYEECKSLLSSSNFNLVTESEDIKIESMGSGNEFYTRSTVLVPSGLFETLVVLYETDLLSTWVSSIKSTQVLLQPTLFRKVLRQHFSFPWPISDRECILEFFGVPDYHKGSVMILMKSCQGAYMEDSFSQRLTPLRVPLGCIYVEFLGPQSTRVVICVHANPDIVSVT